MSILASADAGLLVLRLPLQQNHSGYKGQRLSDLLVKSGFGVPTTGLVSTFFPIKHSPLLRQPVSWPPLLGRGLSPGSIQVLWTPSHQLVTLTCWGAPETWQRTIY